MAETPRRGAVAARAQSFAHERLRHRVVHGEVPVEPGDLQRAPRLEPGRGEQERRAGSSSLRPRLDQHAERGRVDELDLAEIDDDRARASRRRRSVEGLAHLGAL